MIILASEGFSLYQFHPIFEFFLTFYTAYLVSDELKKLLDKKFFGMVKEKFSGILDQHRRDLVQHLNSVISSISDNFPNGTPEFQVTKTQKLSELEKIEGK